VIFVTVKRDALRAAKIGKSTPLLESAVECVSSSADRGDFGHKEPAPSDSATCVTGAGIRTGSA